MVKVAASVIGMLVISALMFVVLTFTKPGLGAGHAAILSGIFGLVVAIGCWLAPNDG